MRSRSGEALARPTHAAIRPGVRSQLSGGKPLVSRRRCTPSGTWLRTARCSPSTVAAAPLATITGRTESLTVTDNPELPRVRSIRITPLDDEGNPIGEPAEVSGFVSFGESWATQVSWPAIVCVHVGYSLAIQAAATWEQLQLRNERARELQLNTPLYSSEPLPPFESEFPLQPPLTAEQHAQLLSGLESQPTVYVTECLKSETGDHESQYGPDAEGVHHWRCVRCWTDTCLPGDCPTQRPASREGDDSPAGDG